MDDGGAVTQVLKKLGLMLLLIRALIKRFWRLHVHLHACTRMRECANVGLRASAFHSE